MIISRRRIPDDVIWDIAVSHLVIAPPHLHRNDRSHRLDGFHIDLR